MLKVNDRLSHFCLTLVDHTSCILDISRLSAVNRWCVTGTPIRDSLTDFHGLMVFLGVDPYNMEQWWRRCLCVPYISGRTSKLESLLAKYMWRTAKRDVLNQIEIPEQSQEIHFLQFSPIEEHFYRQELLLEVMPKPIFLFGSLVQMPSFPSKYSFHA